MSLPFLRKLSKRKTWERLLRERLSEPLHLNACSLFAAAFGSFETKVYFDLVLRQHNAFCLLQAARFAKARGYEAFTAIEFGVANGAGLLNMAAIASKVTRATGIRIELAGFDSGGGMPPARDFRDHPDLYGAGDFPMQDRERLLAKLPGGARLVLGDVAETVGPYLASVRENCPIGYVVLDVDYYSSALECLNVFDGPENLYLPETLLYLDDIAFPRHNPWQGERLALGEFNAGREKRKACPYNFLRSSRLFKNASWIDHVFVMHVLDHAAKSEPREGPPQVLVNPYLADARQGK
jgi:hypothetical protein